ncbi:MAG: hypothetical protein HY884_07790 [Deltaproteobacteria bacterium]|nr:hypothetical protein [Deltaproteobacteria bacterium]
MDTQEIRSLADEGVRLAKCGRFRDALRFFDEDLCFTQDPTALSYYAVCLAEEEGIFDKAISLCVMAAEKEFYNPVVYLNLGRIFLLNRQKKIAIKAFMKGLKFDEKNAEILNIVKKLGKRRKPVVSFLSRNNSLNRLLGMLAARMVH